MQNQTNTQVWIRIHGLPLEYWHPSNLYNITRGTGLPLKVNKKTLELENDMFAIVLVDVDISKHLPEKILVKRKNLNFFVGIIYE